MEYLYFLFNFSVALTFIISGFSKLTERENNIRVIQKLNFFPRTISIAAGTSLPYIEIGLAVLLIFNVYIKISVTVVIILLISFIFANSYVVSKGKDIACNCFGKLLQGKLGMGGLYHSIILLLYSLPLYFIESSSYRDVFVQLSFQQSVLLLLCSIGLVTTGIASRLSDLN